MIHFTLCEKQQLKRAQPRLARPYGSLSLDTPAIEAVCSMGNTRDKGVSSNPDASKALEK